MKDKKMYKSAATVTNKPVTVSKDKNPLEEKVRRLQEHVLQLQAEIDRTKRSVKRQSSDVSDIFSKLRSHNK